MEANETRMIKGFLILLLFVSIIFICVLISSLNKSDKAETENKTLKQNVIESNRIAQSNIDEYNRIKPLILNLNTEISNLKKLSLDKEKEYLILDKKYHENIKIVDKFSINDMQLYFNNRYGTKSNGYKTRFDTIKPSN